MCICNPVSRRPSDRWSIKIKGWFYGLWIPLGIKETILAKYIKLNYLALYSNTTAYVHVTHAFNHEQVVIFDLVRDKLEFINYGLIETLKNGIWFSRKYEL